MKWTPWIKFTARPLEHDGSKYVCVKKIMPDGSIKTSEAEFTVDTYPWDANVIAYRVALENSVFLYGEKGHYTRKRSPYHTTVLEIEIQDGQIIGATNYHLHHGFTE